MIAGVFRNHPINQPPGDPWELLKSGASRSQYLPGSEPSGVSLRRRRRTLRIGRNGPERLEGSRSPQSQVDPAVWLGGGPSHLDLFDPKPKAPVEYRGPFSTIATRTPGVRFTELLPKLAARSNKYSLIEAM